MGDDSNGNVNVDDILDQIQPNNDVAPVLPEWPVDNVQHLMAQLFQAGQASLVARGNVQRALTDLNQICRVQKDRAEKAVNEKEELEKEMKNKDAEMKKKEEEMKKKEEEMKRKEEEMKKKEEEMKKKEEEMKKKEEEMKKKEEEMKKKEEEMARPQQMDQLMTPTSLEMEEGDTIEVYQQQTGGSH